MGSRFTANILLVLCMAMFLIACGEKDNRECVTNDDCPLAYWCDRTVWECKTTGGPPNCTGKCCGDDGEGWFCPDNCPEGTECNITTCQCDVICTSNKDCAMYECCIDTKCMSMDCGFFQCGLDPVCGKECGPCEAEYSCSEFRKCESGVLGEIGDPCPHDPGINTENSSCALGFTCIGAYDQGNCTDVNECGIPSSYNPECYSTRCGYSFCSVSCEVEKCPVGFVENTSLGSCYCFPE